MYAQGTRLYGAGRPGLSVQAGAATTQEDFRRDRRDRKTWPKGSAIYGEEPTMETWKGGFAVLYGFIFFIFVMYNGPFCSGSCGALDDLSYSYCVLSFTPANLEV